MRAELKALLAAALIVYVAGIWWGVPWLWAPDELGPAMIFDALDARFLGGWHDKYPPMQYYLGAIVCLPFLLAARIGHVDPASPAMTVTLFVVLRLLVVAMSVATLAAIYLTAADLYGRRGAFAAAVVAGFTPLVVFYAKLGNVDMPSMFWLAWALRFYVRVVRGGSARDLRWFAVLGVTAIATKDQTAGFFVLPALHVLWLSGRRGAWRPVLAAGALALIVLAVQMQIPFNLSGFVAHVRTITGESSQPFRYPGSTAARQWLVAQRTATELAWSMAWAGLALALLGVIDQIRRRRFLWLLLPIVSYYIFFLVVAGYVYDRFLIGIVLVLAIFAGGWVDDFLRDGVPARRWRVALCAAAGVFIVWSGVSMDVMMVLDSRYAAAAWLRGHRGDGRVALVGYGSYLPHVPGGIRITTGPDAFDQAQQPRFVVLNAEVMRRPVLPPVEREWKAWIESGRSPYVVAARFKTLPAASLLSYTGRFRNGIEDDASNLDKVGPEIVIYWKPGVLR